MKSNRRLHIPFVRIMMTEKGWNQKQLAEQIGISKDTVSLWMTEKTSPSWNNIVKLAEVLDVSVNQVLLNDPIMVSNLLDEMFNELMNSYRDMKNTTNDKKREQITQANKSLARCIDFTKVMCAYIENNVMPQANQEQEDDEDDGVFKPRITGEEALDLI